MTAEIEDRFTSFANARALSLTDFSGVYFLCQGATIIYVGHTRNIPQRIQSHRRDKAFDTVMVMRVPEELLASVELHWIQRLRPKFNHRHYDREPLTLRLPADTVRGVKRAAARQKKSQADYVNDVVRPVLIAEGFIKEKAQ